MAGQQVCLCVYAHVNGHSVCTCVVVGECVPVYTPAHLCPCNTLHWHCCCIAHTLAPPRYDPAAEVPSDTDSLEDRVIFVKAVTQFMVGSMNGLSYPVRPSYQ